MNIEVEPLVLIKESSLHKLIAAVDIVCKSNPTPGNGAYVDREELEALRKAIAEFKEANE